MYLVVGRENCPYCEDDDWLEYVSFDAILKSILEAYDYD